MITVKRFTAPWCGPCKMLAPVMNSLQQELPDVDFETIDVDRYPDEAQQFGIRSVPTVIIIKDGVKKNTILGVNPKNTYIQAIQQNI